MSSAISLPAALDVLAGKQLGRWQVHAVAVHRVLERQVIGKPGREVIMTVPGRDMHGAGTGVERDEIGIDHRNAPVVKRMLQFEAVQQRPCELGQHLAAGRAIARQRLFGQLLGQHQKMSLAIDFRLDQHVRQLRTQRDRLVRGQRPGRGGPDRHGSAQPLLARHRLQARTDALEQFFRIDHRESARRWQTIACPGTRLRLRPAPTRSRDTSARACSPAAGDRSR